MTRHDDRPPEMLSGIRIDAAIDQALHDATVTDDVAPFAGFVHDLRVMADRPAPLPSAELAALLAGHHAAELETHATVATLRPRRQHRVHPRATRRGSGRSPAPAMRMRIGALGLAGKAAMVAAFATTAVAGAAAGILPEPATRFIQRAVEVVTPFELPATGQGAGREDHAEAAAAEKPDHAGPAAGPDPALMVHPPDVAGTPTPDGEPLADATTPARPSSATAIGNAVTRHVEPGAPGPRGRPDTTLPTAPHPSADPANGRSPDHEPPAGPAPKNGHIPPGHAPPGAPHPGGGNSDDAPLVDVGSNPASLSASKGPPKAESPGGPPSGPGRQGPHHGRPGGPQPVEEPRGQAPSNVRGPAQRPGRSPGGHPGHDPAPPADGDRGAPHRRGQRAMGGEAPHHSDGRSG
jgi:hypothetical protein